MRGCNGDGIQNPATTEERRPQSFTEECTLNAIKLLRVLFGSKICRQAKCAMSAQDLASPNEYKLLKGFFDFAL